MLIRDLNIGRNKGTVEKDKEIKAPEEYQKDEILGNLEMHQPDALAFAAF
jgi:hypothetical protein